MLARCAATAEILVHAGFGETVEALDGGTELGGEVLAQPDAAGVRGELGQPFVDRCGEILEEGKAFVRL